MSKNLTRKGLALGAIVALGSSLFAGAPANAAASLSVVPDSGTGFTVLASDTFKVRTLGVDYTLSNTSELQYKITKPSSTATVSYVLSNHETTYGSTTPVAVISTGAVDYIKSGATSTVGSRPALEIQPTINTADTSQDYVVQAFIESGNAAGLDASDTVVSSAVTVKFVKSAVPTVTVDKVSAGQFVTGTVAYANDFNYAQSLESSTKVLFSDQGGSFDAASVAVTRNSASTGFEFKSATVSAPAVAVSDVIGVKARTYGYDSDTTFNFSAVVYSTADAASTATAADTTITRGDNISLTGTAAVVRAGTKAFSYRVDFTKANEVQSVGAGQSVQIVATEVSNTIVTGDVVRVNGKAITGSNTSAQSAVLNTVTDAKGGVTIDVASDLGLALNALRIQVKATGVANVESDYAFTWTTAALAEMTETNTPLVGSQSVVRGSSVSVTYALRDQFGALWTKTGTDYQVYAVASGGTLVLTQTAQFAAGVATLTFTDNSTSAGTPTLTSKLKLKTTGDYSWATAQNATTETTTRIFNVVTTAPAAASITTNAALTGATPWNLTASSAAGVKDTAVSRSTKRLKAIDLRSNKNGAGLAVVAGDGVKVTGTVLNADGSAAAGAAVTVASKGLFFGTDATASTYVSADSITVNTSLTGTYEVYAYTQKAGDAAITITSGSVVKTQNVAFKAAAANSGANLKITAPAETLAGRAVNVVVALTDEFGSPVTSVTTTSPISVTLTGVGYPTTVAANTDENGLISFKLVLGADEIGVATITAKYDGDGTGTDYLPITTVATVNVVKALTTAAGTAAVSGSTGKFYVSATAAAGKLVVVKVAGKFVTSFKATGSKKSVAVKSSKGSKKVTVFVGGKLAATKTVTVK